MGGQEGKWKGEKGSSLPAQQRHGPHQAPGMQAPHQPAADTRSHPPPARRTSSRIAWRRCRFCTSRVLRAFSSFNCPTLSSSAALVCSRGVSRRRAGGEGQAVGRGDVVMHKQGGAGHADGGSAACAGAAMPRQRAQGCQRAPHHQRSAHTTRPAALTASCSASSRRTRISCWCCSNSSPLPMACMLGGRRWVA